MNEAENTSHKAIRYANERAKRLEELAEGAAICCLTEGCGDGCEARVANVLGLAYEAGRKDASDAGQSNAGWVATKDRLPEAKEGFEHTEQCLVWYQPTTDAVGNFGIAYYHYNSPYKGAGWIDFAHLGRTPTHWQKITPPADITEPEDK